MHPGDKLPYKPDRTFPLYNSLLLGRFIEALLLQVAVVSPAEKYEVRQKLFSYRFCDKV